ncbi:unnamed protein product [Effrenium voratum]|nr:unnamed protein product [Effrenium voratum]
MAGSEALVRHDALKALVRGAGHRHLSRIWRSSCRMTLAEPEAWKASAIGIGLVAMERGLFRAEEAGQPDRMMLLLPTIRGALATRRDLDQHHLADVMKNSPSRGQSCHGRLRG